MATSEQSSLFLFPSFLAAEHAGILCNHRRAHDAEKIIMWSAHNKHACRPILHYSNNIENSLRAQDLKEPVPYINVRN